VVAYHLTQVVTLSEGNSLPLSDAVLQQAALAMLQAAEECEAVMNLEDAAHWYTRGCDALRKALALDSRSLEAVADAYVPKLRQLACDSGDIAQLRRELAGAQSLAAAVKRWVRGQGQQPGNSDYGSPRGSASVSAKPNGEALRHMSSKAAPAPKAAPLPRVKAQPHVPDASASPDELELSF
jgi:hypothetical protein